MYHVINPACSKAILAQLAAEDLKKHFDHLLKKLETETDLNRQAMYWNLVRFCVFRAKNEFPKVDLFASLE